MKIYKKGKDGHRLTGDHAVWKNDQMNEVAIYVVHMFELNLEKKCIYDLSMSRYIWWIWIELNSGGRELCNSWHRHLCRNRELQL